MVLRKFLSICKHVRMLSIKRRIISQFSKRTRIASLVFLTLIFFSLPGKVSAGSWGEPTSAAIMKEYMEKITYSIYGSLLVSLKMAAVQMLNQQVGQLIGGGASGQARFITNYNDFLYQGPQQRTDVYMNDFFTLTTRGRGSSANYIGIGDTGGMGGNYVSSLDSVQRQASVGNETISVYNLDEYGGIEAVGEGDFRALYAFVSNPCNNPYGCALQAERVSQDKLAKEQQIAAIKANAAGGFLPVEEDGMVITPAGSVEAVTTNIQKLPIDIIASASNPAELLGGVVSSMATKVVTNLVQNGIGQVQTNIQREFGGVNSQVDSALKQATGSLGPAAPFTQNILQRSVIVNPSTLPIPNNGTGGP